MTQLLPPTSPEPPSKHKDRPRAHVLDGHPSVLDFLGRMLPSVGFEPVLHSSPESLIDALTPNEVGCALVELFLPGSSGLDVITRAYIRRPHVPVIVMSEHASLLDHREATRRGAFGFLNKPFDVSKLRDLLGKALDRVLQNLERADQRRDFRQALERLSPREAQLLPLLCSDRCVKEIAFELGLSPKTVFAHRTSIIRRLGCSSMEELAARRLHDQAAAR